MEPTIPKLDPTKPVSLIPHQTFYDSQMNPYPGGGSIYQPGELPSSLFQHCRNVGDNTSPVAVVPFVPQVTVVPSKPVESKITTVPASTTSAIHQINLNTANSDAIAKVEGITTVMINAIVRERDKVPFVDKADLLARVPKLASLDATIISSNFSFT